MIFINNKKKGRRRLTRPFEWCSLFFWPPGGAAGVSLNLTELFWAVSLLVTGLEHRCFVGELTNSDQGTGNGVTVILAKSLKNWGILIRMAVILVEIGCTLEKCMLFSLTGSKMLQFSNLKTTVQECQRKHKKIPPSEIKELHCNKVPLTRNYVRNYPFKSLITDQNTKNRLFSKIWDFQFQCPTYLSNLKLTLMNMITYVNRFDMRTKKFCYCS